MDALKAALKKAYATAYYAIADNRNKVWVIVFVAASCLLFGSDKTVEWIEAVAAFVASAFYGATP